MKLNGRFLVVAAMVLGSAGALGCKANAPVDGDTTDTANVAGDVSLAATTDVAGPTVPAPPPPRVEVEGPAPSAHHVWVPGYWYFAADAGDYAWAPGYWQDRDVVVAVAPPPLRDEYVGYAPGDGYFWAPGFWRWSGVEYAWAPGHWSLRREGFGWLRPTWTFRDGRWACNGFGWERRHDAVSVAPPARVAPAPAHVAPLPAHVVSVQPAAAAHPAQHVSGPVHTPAPGRTRHI